VGVFLWEINQSDLRFITDPAFAFPSGTTLSPPMKEQAITGLQEKPHFVRIENLCFPRGYVACRGCLDSGNSTVILMYAQNVDAPPEVDSSTTESTPTLDGLAYIPIVSHLLESSLGRGCGH